MCNEHVMEKGARYVRGGFNVPASTDRVFGVVNMTFSGCTVAPLPPFVVQVNSLFVGKYARNTKDSVCTAPKGTSNRSVCRNAGGDVVRRNLYLNTPRSRLTMDKSYSCGRSERNNGRYSISKEPSGLPAMGTNSLTRIT